MNEDIKVNKVTACCKNTIKISACVFVSCKNIEIISMCLPARFKDRHECVHVPAQYLFYWSINQQNIFFLPKFFSIVYWVKIAGLEEVFNQPLHILPAPYDLKDICLSALYKATNLIRYFTIF